jgi:hypothetical protein
MLYKENEITEVQGLQGPTAYQVKLDKGSYYLTFTSPNLDDVKHEIDKNKAGA